MVSCLAYFSCLQLLLGVLMSKHRFSPVFYSRMFDEIRCSSDVLQPDSQSTNMVDMSCLMLSYSQIMMMMMTMSCFTSLKLYVARVMARG